MTPAKPASHSTQDASSRQHLVTAARSGGIALFGSGVAAISGLVLNMVVGRTFGAVASGVFFVVVAVITVTTTVARAGADTGLVWSLPRLKVLGRAAETGRMVRVAVVPVLVTSIVIAVLTAAFATPIAQRITDPDKVQQTAELLKLGAPFIVLLALTFVLTAGLRGLGSIVSYTVIQQLMVQGLRPIIVVFTSLMGLGLIGVMWAWGSPLLAAIVMASVLLRRKVAAVQNDAAPSARRSSSWRELAREFWRFSSARSISAILESAIIWADVIIVASLTGSREAGIYAAASRFVTTGTLVEAALRVAMGPLLSARLAARDLIGASELYQAATQWIILLSFPLYLGIGLYASAVLSIFGPGFSEGATALSILCASMLVSMATGNSQTVLLMSGRSIWQMSNKAAVLAFNLVLNLLLVPRYGMNGAAIAWAGTILLDSTMVIIQVHLLVGVRLRIFGLMHAIGLSLLSFGVVGVLLRVFTDLSAPVALCGLAASSLIHLALVYRYRQQFDADALIAAVRRRSASPAELPTSHRKDQA